MFILFLDKISPLVEFELHPSYDHLYLEVERVMRPLAGECEIFSNNRIT